MKYIEGFSKLNKQEKIDVINSFGESEVLEGMDLFWHSSKDQQKTFDEFSENTISNFYLPYGIAPNFYINNEFYFIPMVTEESSVVAAASKAAKFWSSKGGLSAKVLGTTKTGQVHFLWNGEKKKLLNFFNLHKTKFINSTKDITLNMDKRGGGILDMDLMDKTEALENYYQLEVSFNTCDAMGANFINSVLERVAKKLEKFVSEYESFNGQEKELEVIMSILSNYTPSCIVHASASCLISELDDCVEGMDGKTFANKFEKACNIAKVDVSRAVTHNKGIFNGVDSVVLATGNDFRAVEACGHAYAARDGSYRGLSDCNIENDRFIFEMTIPLALGSVGGLTNLHPLAKASLKLLGNPSSSELMQIAASVGLAQNFSALRSLVSCGIQKGHMKMHLLNILRQLDASESDIEVAKVYFKDNVVSFSNVRDFLNGRKSIQ